MGSEEIICSLVAKMSDLELAREYLVYEDVMNINGIVETMLIDEVSDLREFVRDEICIRFLRIVENLLESLQVS